MRDGKPSHVRIVSYPRTGGPQPGNLWPARLVGEEVALWPELGRYEHRSDKAEVGGSTPPGRTVGCRRNPYPVIIDRGVASVILRGG